MSVECCGGASRRLWRGAEALLSGKPLSLTAFAQAGVRDAVSEVLARHPIETIFVYSGQMAQYLPPSFDGQVVMDFVDVDSAKFEAYGATTGGFAGWMLRREARRLAAFEAGVAARVNASLFVSAAEAELFRERSGATRVHAVENGIDTASFDPALAFPAIDGAGPLIVFTGQMDYRPNIEGVTWFVEAVLPLVRARYPEARFAIVGRKPAAAVQTLVAQPGVTVTGEVPDVRPWLAAASVVVAPLTLARGVQNKVLEAMAMARPVVASSAAATGIDHGGTIEVAETAEEMAAAIGGLLSDPGRAVALGAAARRRVVDHYGWDAKLAVLDRIMQPNAGRVAA